ncbi:hypothetical protein [Actinomadura macrotermitis]|uniref:Uncharacterized protein n=1 Tax=Actinomadura macrotermitis TaxID=2585200 RepID=A0A7K0BXK1_9ACTN|nr:hypothetical protein [Actinomadura macrotermitis]MQY05917.1 hypothetical protein [Actinomadura macrotermitis]
MPPEEPNRNGSQNDGRGHNDAHQRAQRQQAKRDAARAAIVTIYVTGIPGFAGALAANREYFVAAAVLTAGILVLAVLWWLPGNWFFSFLRSAWAAFCRIGTFYRENWLVCTAAATAVVIVAGLVIWNLLPRRCGSLAENEGECIGIADGTKPDVFGARFERVMRAIGAENKLVTDGGSQKYATIAFMAPVTEKTLHDDRILHELEGAATAQYRANRANSKGLPLGGAPQIRLVVANPGSGERYWERVVEKIKRLRGGHDHLTAVTGMGFSQTETVQAVRALSKEQIPVVGDIITADGFDMTGRIDSRGPIPGLFRMPFPVSRQFTEVAKTLRKNPAKNGRPLRALLVRDSSVESSQPDLYTKSLSDAFQRGVFGGYLKNSGTKINVFGNRNADEGDLENDFTTISNNVCGTDPPDLVFYAGRAMYMVKFLNLLVKRNCSGPVTVVTGSDASVLYLNPPVRDALLHPDPQQGRSPTSVVFVPLVHQASLHPPQGKAQPANLRSFISDFTDRGFPAADVDDGWAVMAHDAMFTATRCTRMAAGNRDKPPAPDAVVRQCRGVTSSNNSIPGATGFFQLDSTTGDRVGGLPPVVDIIGPS